MKYNVKRACIFHLILAGIPSSLTLSVKNMGAGGGLLNKQNLLGLAVVVKQLSICQWSFTPRITCMLSFDFKLQRDLKNIFCYQHDVENYTDQVLNFLLFNRHRYIHMESSGLYGQHTYVTGLFNFFFVLQDLIDRIDSYFQGIAFQRNLLLIGF